MLSTALAQLRVAVSVAFGLPFAPWSLDRLIAGALATQHEFGALGSDAAGMLGGPLLDDATIRDVHQRRFRAQAQRAAAETSYYQRLFAALEVDPSRLTYADIGRLPCTPKSDLAQDLQAFVSRRVRPVLVARTSGTTGRPIRIGFSARELQTLTALSALGFLLSNQLGPEDVVYVGVDRLGIGALTLLGACARIGAGCVLAGQLAPEATLERLAAPLGLPGKRPRASVLHVHPSYLGHLVEAGARLGYGPKDFGVRCVLTGGEVVTAGLRARLPAIFGDATVVETYGMTETFGAGGEICPDGHLHVHPAHALVEVIDPDSHAPAAAGEVGTLVVTPLPPFRETTMLLRYDTQDLVKALPGPPDCALRGLPAVSQLLGKRRFAVLGGALGLYDLVATWLLPLTDELHAHLAALPLTPVVAWGAGDEGGGVSLGLGDLLLATVYPLVQRKAYGPGAGLVALGLSLASIAMLLLLSTLRLLPGSFPVMVVLGPVGVAQWAVCAWWRGPERTTWQYLHAELATTG